MGKEKRTKDTVSAIDSGIFERGGFRKALFKAPLGVAVTLDNYADYKKFYDKTLAELFKKHGRNREKYVYSASGIMSLFNNPAESDEFFENFFKAVASRIKHLDIFYTYFPKNQPPSISIYGRGQTPVETLSPIKFIENKLINAYPHNCAWRFVETHSEFKDNQIFLDHFQSEVTQSWFALQNLPNIHIFLKGDECNCAISTADILLKIINNRLFRAKKGLYPNDLEDILPEVSDRLTSHFLGAKYLQYLVPVFPKQINFEDKIKHPIIYLLREPESPIVTRKVSESSPLWACIQNLAFQYDGCVKFFDPNTDYKKIKPGDIMTYMGPEGEKAASIYLKMGYKVKVIPPEQILSEYACKS